MTHMSRAQLVIINNKLIPSFVCCRNEMMKHQKSPELYAHWNSARIFFLFIWHSNDPSKNHITSHILLKVILAIPCNIHLLFDTEIAHIQYSWWKNSCTQFYGRCYKGENVIERVNANFKSHLNATLMTNIMFSILLI